MGDTSDFLSSPIRHRDKQASFQRYLTYVNDWNILLIHFLKKTLNLRSTGPNVSLDLHDRADNWYKWHKAAGWKTHTECSGTHSLCAHPNMFLAPPQPRLPLDQEDLLPDKAMLQNHSPALKIKCQKSKLTQAGPVAFLNDFSVVTRATRWHLRTLPFLGVKRKTGWMRVQQELTRPRPSLAGQGRGRCPRTGGSPE